MVDWSDAFSDDPGGADGGDSGGGDDGGGDGGGGNVDVGGGPDPGDVNVDIGDDSDGSSGDGGGGDSSGSDGGSDDGGDPYRDDPRQDVENQDGVPNPGDGTDPSDGGSDDTRISDPNYTGAPPVDEQQGIETSDPDEVFKVSEPGKQTRRTGRQAQELQQAIVERNEDLDEDDVGVRMTAGGLEPFLTQEGQVSQAADSLGVTEDDLGIGYGNTIRARSERGESAFELEQARQRIQDAYPDAQGMSIQGVADDAYIAEVQTEQGVVTERIAFSDAGETYLENQQSGQADGRAPINGDPEVSPAGPGVEPSRDDDAFGGPDRDLYNDGTDTETIGAAGPMGVTVPVNRDAGATFEAGMEAGRGALDDAFLFEYQEGTGEFDGPVDVPDGAPGAGVAERPGGPRVTLGDLWEEAQDVGIWGYQEGTGEFEGPVDVPEGAPGPGVAVRPDGPRVTLDELVQRTEDSLTAEPVREPDVSVADNDRVVGEAGPLGVDAPAEQTDIEDVEQFASGIGIWGHDVIETFESERPSGEAFVGGTVAGGLVQEGRRAETLEAIDEGSVEGEYPTTAEARAGVGDTITDVGGAVSEPLDRELRSPERNVNVSEELGDLIVTEREARMQEPEGDQFGDWDPVIAGVDVEQTAEEASAAFRQGTTAFAEGTTDALGLREGSFADRAAETGLRTFPEIFNPGGLVKDTLEVGETIDYVAADPGDRGPEVYQAGQRRAGELADYYESRPGAALGTGLALGAQIPLSLGAIRGLGAVSARAGRGLDVVWNTPERVARRTLGSSDRGPFDEVQQFVDDVNEPIPEYRQAVVEREAGLTPRSMLRDDAGLYDYVPFPDRQAIEARLREEMARTDRGQLGAPKSGGLFGRGEAETADDPVEITADDIAEPLDDPRPGRFGQEPPREIEGETGGELDDGFSYYERERRRRRRQSQESSLETETEEPAATGGAVDRLILAETNILGQQDSALAPEATEEGFEVFEDTGVEIRSLGETEVGLRSDAELEQEQELEQRPETDLWGELESEPERESEPEPEPEPEPEIWEGEPEPEPEPRVEELEEEEVREGPFAAYRSDLISTGIPSVDELLGGDGAGDEAATRERLWGDSGDGRGSRATEGDGVGRDRRTSRDRGRSDGRDQRRRRGLEDPGLRDGGLMGEPTREDRGVFDDVGRSSDDEAGAWGEDYGDEDGGAFPEDDGLY